MDTRVWGPHAWIFLHTVTFNYPQEASDADKQSIRTFVQSVGSQLPCPTCQVHFAKLLKDYPIEKVWQSRDALSRWMVNLHNMVNRRLNKPEYEYDVVRSRYESIRGKTCEANQTNNCPPLKSDSVCLGSAKMSKEKVTIIIMGTLLGLIVVGSLAAFFVCRLTRRRC